MISSIKFIYKPILQNVSVVGGSKCILQRRNSHVFSYRVAPPPHSKSTQIGAELVGASMWWWVLWHLWHEYEHVTVWADYKNHVKVKCRQNKNSLSGTGGGPSKFCSLTQLEDKVVDLLSIDKAVSGIDGTYRFGVNTKENTPPTTTLDIVQDSLMENFINIASDEPTPIPSEEISPGTSPTGNQRTQVQSKESLLQKQVGNQIKCQENSIKLMTEVDKNIKGCLSVLNNVNENLSEVKKFLKRSCEWQEKHYRLAKEKFEFKKKIELESSKQKMLQYEFKKQISDCQENKYKPAE